MLGWVGHLNYVSNACLFDVSMQECTFCRKPLLFDLFEEREHGHLNVAQQQMACGIPNCPQMVAAH